MYYLCINKLKKYMENELMIMGFIKTENPNEYVKNNLTIRLEDDTIEIFNDPDIEKGIYYIGSISTTNLEDLFDEINEYLLK